MQGKKTKNSQNFESTRTRPQKLAAEFGERLLVLRRKLGLKQSEMVAALGHIGVNSLSRLERSYAEAIPFEIIPALLQLAQQAGFTAEWLLTGSRVSANLSRDDLIEALGRVLAREMIAPDGPTPATRRAAEAIAAPHRPADGQGWKPVRLVEPGFRIVSLEDLPDDWRGSYVPLLGRLAAGEGVDTIEAEEHPPGWAAAFVAFADAPPAAFALSVVGDSMAPEYRPGDVVIVDGSTNVDRGLACVIYEVRGVRIARLKIVRRSGRRIVLDSSNPSHKPAVLDKGQVEAYKVVRHLPRITESAPQKE